MFNLVIFGPPGAGKGTQSARIIEKYNLAHISTGDMFRMHITENTVLGQEVKELLAEGILVPDSITIKMLEEEVDRNPNVSGFIFDGFPRTVAQAEALDLFLKSKNEEINLVLQLDVDEDESKLVRRIDEYFQKTVHVLPYYEQQGKLVKIEGVGEIDVIFGNISNTIDEYI
jgi:adenylate kinase